MGTWHCLGAGASYRGAHVLMPVLTPPLGSLGACVCHVLGYLLVSTCVTACQTKSLGLALWEGSDSSLNRFSCVRKAGLPFQEALPGKINQQNSWGRAADGGCRVRRRGGAEQRSLQRKAVK